MTDASKQQAENRIAEIDQAQQLTNELKGLVDANGKVAASDQERAAGIYEIVNDLMPGLVKRPGKEKKQITNLQRASTLSSKRRKLSP
ncbi:MAG: hypothetical protein V8Q39_00075 [Anaerovoracaceae bacterium]